MKIIDLYSWLTTEGNKKSGDIHPWGGCGKMHFIYACHMTPV